GLDAFVAEAARWLVRSLLADVTALPAIIEAAAHHAGAGGPADGAPAAPAIMVPLTGP
ncbi:MAG: hypothetical protein JWO75_3783, partial [Actinomycetia bacterium]|nr:hypothetical protein [Actinomycetes bacterium]